MFGGVSEGIVCSVLRTECARNFACIFGNFFRIEGALIECKRDFVVGAVGECAGFAVEVGDSDGRIVRSESILRERDLTTVD